MTNESLNIYFAHAIVDYDTEYEDLCIQTIHKYYDNCIIHNPKDLNLKDKNIDEVVKFKLYFFPIIDNCNLVFASPAFNHPSRKGQFLGGTTKEMVYAIKNNKQVVALINDELKDINRDFFSDLRWETYGGNE